MKNLQKLLVYYFNYEFLGISIKQGHLDFLLFFCHQLNDENENVAYAHVGLNISSQNMKFQKVTIINLHIKKKNL